ncbi:MAG: ABC transporter ATP-binding protein [Aquabacterium sp.]
MSSTASPVSPPVLQADLRAVTLSGRRILGPQTLSLSAGRWTAIVGPNGAGKSTLLRTLAGLQPCDGEVSLKGQPMAQWPAKARARCLSWLGQAETGADDLRAGDVVMLGRLPHQAWLSAPSEADHAAVRQAMAQTQCWPWRDRLVSQLSGGERQRVLLARALAVQADVMLMDEPLAHLDPPHQADWLDIVRALRSRGVTVLSVLHELNMALHADELIVMAQGQVRYHGPAHERASHEAVMQVFDGRVKLHALGDQWVALPCSAPGEVTSA